MSGLLGGGGVVVCCVACLVGVWVECPGLVGSCGAAVARSVLRRGSGVVLVVRPATWCSGVRCLCGLLAAGGGVCCVVCLSGVWWEGRGIEAMRNGREKRGELRCKSQKKLWITHYKRTDGCLLWGRGSVFGGGASCPKCATRHFEIGSHDALELEMPIGGGHSRGKKTSKKPKTAFLCIRERIAVAKWTPPPDKPSSFLDLLFEAPLSSEADSICASKKRNAHVRNALDKGNP